MAMDADKLELMIQRMSRADKLRATDRRAADQIATRKRLGEYDPNSRMAQKFRNDMIMAAIEMMESGYKDGGEAVPKKFKGFSRLPEAVQQKMSPGLANKYKDGGEARNSRKRGSCRGMGSALRGGSFSGVK